MANPNASLIGKYACEHSRELEFGVLQFSKGSLEKEKLLQREDGLTVIKRRRRNLSSNGVRDLVTASGRGRLKEDLESSTLRWRQDYKEHLKMEMEIPCSNKIKFITACSFSNDSFEDIMKAQVSVIKASATLNIQAFKIKKSVSISFRMTQVHKMAKDHMMMIRDYDWMMISKKLKDHIQVKLKPKSLKFTASDSQDTDQ
ncbi:hypothetical protein Tco_1400133 [Tanacetum coccineum]